MTEKDSCPFETFFVVEGGPIFANLMVLMSAQ